MEHMQTEKPGRNQRRPVMISQVCQREQELQEMLWDPELMREQLDRQRARIPLANLMRAMELQRAEDVRQIIGQ